MNSALPPPRGRLAYLDWLRFLVVLCLAPFHAAISFTGMSSGYRQRYLNRPSRTLGIARDLSFPLYILHYAPLTAATYLLLNSGLSIWTRWLLAVAASWSFVALFTFLARFIPLVRRFFGIRQPAVKTL